MKDLRFFKLLIIFLLLQTDGFAKDYSILKKIDQLKFEAIKKREEKKSAEKEKQRIEKELENLEVKYKNLESLLKDAKIEVQNLLKDIDEIQKMKKSFLLGKSFLYLEWIRIERLLNEVFKSKINNLSKILNDFNDAKVFYFLLTVAKANMFVINKTINGSERKFEENIREIREIGEKAKKEQSFYRKLILEGEIAKDELNGILNKIAKEDFTPMGFSQMKGKLSLPITAGRIKIPYGEKIHPVFKTKTFHKGLTIEPPSLKGEVRNVRSVFFGKVVFAGTLPGFGNVLIIDHAEGYHTLYANLSTTNVRQGDIVEEGDVIAKLIKIRGVEESFSLYFEMRYNGKAIDPEEWFIK